MDPAVTDRRGVGLVVSVIVLLSVALTACATAPVTEVLVDEGEIVFSGERALELVTEFATSFPNRDSGQPNNAAAADWLYREFTALGLACRIDRWETVNYGLAVPMQNVVCEHPGERAEQVVLVAHLDQSPRTVQGADNDASGIGVLLHLAEVFAAEPMPTYGLVFVASDGEEYGMLGTRRFLRTHPAPERVVAGISLDNVGKWFYQGVDLDPRGQFRGYGALWFQLLVRDVALAVGETPAPRVFGPLDQVLGQAVPISFMDEGPLVAAGIPAVGLAGTVPPEHAELHYATYHDPGDTLELQAAGPLGHTGRVTEAAVRQLQAMPTFPTESGPFLYFEDARTVLRGWPLTLALWGFVALFALSGAWLLARAARRERPAWRAVAVHLASLWLPLVAAVALLYGFVAVGLLQAFELYVATPKDPVLTSPCWPAIGLWLLALAGLVALSRWLAGRLGGGAAPSPRLVKGASLLAVAIAAASITLTVPFALLFLLPLIAWFAIGPRRGWGRVADVAALLAGGLVVYVLLYVMGFEILRIGWHIFWYLLMMFAVGTVSFPAALVITAVLAAGLALVLRPVGTSVAASSGVVWAVVGVGVMRRVVTLALLVSLIGCQSMQEVMEETGEWRAGAVGVSVLDGTPYAYDVPGNLVIKDHEDACVVVMGWDESRLGHASFRLEPPVDGTYGGTEGGISVTVQEGGRYLSWSVDTAPWLIDVNAVVVKGGNGYRVFAYRQRSDEAGSSIPHQDAWLRAPTNRGGRVPEIGHVTFCYWDEASTRLPDVVWGRQLWAFSGAGAVAVRGDGRIAVAGETYDPITDVSDGYVAYFQPDGGLIDRWTFGTEAIDRVHEIEFTNDGHLVVVGSTHGQLFPELGGTHAGGADVFVMKIDPDDGIIWFRQFGSEHDERGHGVSIDGNGDVVVIGDGGADDERMAMHLTRFDTDGNLVWTISLALPEARVSGIGVVVFDGNAYVVGTTTGDLADVGDGGARHLGARHGGYDPYVAKFQPSGALEWTYQFGSEADDAGRAITVCNAGHLRVAGMTLGELTADRVNPGGADLFVLRVSHEGQEEWRVQFGSDADDHLHVTRHVMVPGMPDGHTVLVGTTYGDFAHAGAHAGEADVFVVRLDHDGSELWRRQYGGDLWDFGASVAYAPDDTLLVAVGSESHMIVSDAQEPGYNSVILKMRP